MKAYKPMTHEIRNKVAMAMKNGLDISDIIQEHDIAGENLAGAIIKKLNRPASNLKNTNFTNAVIGQEGTICNLTGSNLTGCNFTKVKFNGVIWFRRCNLQNVNFFGAWMPYVELNGSDISNIKICDAFIRVGTKNWYGTIGKPYRNEQLESITEIQEQTLGR